MYCLEWNFTGGNSSRFMVTSQYLHNNNIFHLTLIICLPSDKVRVGVSYLYGFLQHFCHTTLHHWLVHIPFTPNIQFMWCCSKHEINFRERREEFGKIILIACGTHYVFITYSWYVCYMLPVCLLYTLLHTL